MPTHASSVLQTHIAAMGGDLNMKKGWHTQTMENLERVWKAEQKHAAEQRKIEQLKKELMEERQLESIRSQAQASGAVP